ncbi:isoamyl alcohol oxidase [Plectosphaerella plurivora]|uniref:Isoamyl alcohol oxidase n=1 Tax=Plectosphaerella plurivora TaxID=936078 RepID=A0A9P9A810_9PEZI|nr:isoamyl alcohol oxidase [Plectosphaerella plurivora]
MTRLLTFATVSVTSLAATVFASACPPRLVPVEIDGVQYNCKCSPADPCWPDKNAWDALNATVNGALIAHIPPAAVCYNEFRGQLTFDAAACADAKANWASEDWQIGRPAAALWTWGSNNTCELTDNRDATCGMGNYPEFVIMAKTQAQVKAGVDFARNRNIRLVIRNTGHDFEARSVGAGSLAINTHGLQDISFTDTYDGPGDYQGPAVTVGAGVQGFQLLDFAHALTPPQTVVTGECGTVGVAGGFIQGGGHGPLTSMYGFAADNALSFDVIDSSGNSIKANAESNSDLFWALKGGGPGNYAAVISVTMRTYPDDVPTAGIYLNVNATTGAQFPQVLRATHIINEQANSLVEKGLYAIYELYPVPILGALHVQPIMGFNMTASELDAAVKPLLEAFDAEGIPYDTGTLEFSDYYSIYRGFFEPEAAAQNGLTGGWTFTRGDLRAENQAAVAEVIEMSLSPRPDLLGIIISHLFDPGLTVSESRSSTHPRWKGATMRTMSILIQGLNATWDQKLDLNDVMVNNITEKYKQAAPNGLAYVNENYAFMNDWQSAFWGDNYPKLKDIKKQWDPAGVFYSPSTPGSEDWHIVDFAHRLCMKK